MIRLGRTLGEFIDRLSPKEAKPADYVRSEKTFSSGQLTSVQRGDLFQLTKHPGYTALLDLMEMLCIAQETNLVNVPVTEEKAVLAEHRMSKAFWQIFTGLQKRVQNECDLFLNLNAEKDRQELDEVIGRSDAAMGDTYN